MLLKSLDRPFLPVFHNDEPVGVMTLERIRQLVGKYQEHPEVGGLSVQMSMLSPLTVAHASDSLLNVATEIIRKNAQAVLLESHGRYEAMVTVTEVFAELVKACQLESPTEIVNKSIFEVMGCCHD